MEDFWKVKGMLNMVVGVFILMYYINNDYSMWCFLIKNVYLRICDKDIFIRLRKLDRFLLVSKREWLCLISC